MASRDLKVTLIGEDRTGSAFGSAGSNADGLNSRFGKLGKTIGLALGGLAAAGVAGLGAAFVQGVKDAASYEKITDQVAQTIKSTGAAAGVSIAGLKDYAGQLESMSGVDEELILSGQNVLLTFTNVQNKVGAGNDIFDQASEAALNLSTTMGGDLVGANTLVGKALNDPIAGMTALRRAGVQLTEAQQDQIRTMVESGDVMGAQKVLLGELETQFGGAAEAAGKGLTGSIARAKDAFQDMFREIATALLPTLTSLATWFAETGIPALKEFGGWVKDNSGWLVPLAAAIGTVVTVVKAWSIAQGILNAVMAMNPIVLIVAAIAALVTGLVLAYQKSETFRDIVNGVFTAVAKAVGDAIGFMIQGFRGLLTVWLTIADGIVSGAAAALGWIPGLGGKLQAANTAFDNMKDGILETLDNAAQAAYGFGENSGRNAASGLDATKQDAFNAGQRVANDMGRGVGSGAGGAYNAGYGVGSNAGQGVTDGIRAHQAEAVSAANAMANKVAAAMRNALDIHSPSRVTMWMGEMLGAGLEIGIRRSEDGVLQAMGNLTGKLTRVGMPTLAPAFGAPAAMQSMGVRSPATLAASAAPAAPALHIENYNEARQPVHEIAQEFAFLARTR